MVYKRSLGEWVFDGINVTFLGLFVVVTLYPFAHVIFSSISEYHRLIKHVGVLLKPLGFSLGAYKMVFKNPMILRGYLNTLFIIIVGTSLNLFMTSLGAYVLSRKRVYWKNFIMFLIVFTMFFEGGLIPFYLLVKKLGLANTLWALIIPYAIATYNLIIMRTYFLSIPDSLEESARIDGANDFTILFRIILPLSMPVVAVMLLFYGVHHWNSWFPAMIFIRKRELFPLQLILREILIQNALADMFSEVATMDDEPVGETIQYATVVVATVPILCVYPFLQRYFVKGVMIGALKE
jgi:putative aldouronate transport system permease protein